MMQLHKKLDWILEFFWESKQRTSYGFIWYLAFPWEKVWSYLSFATAEFLLGVSVLSNSLLYLSVTDLASMQLQLPKKICYKISASVNVCSNGITLCKEYLMSSLSSFFICCLFKRRLFFQIFCWAFGLFWTWYSTIHFLIQFFMPAN